jgi:hypothetical protein
VVTHPHSDAPTVLCATSHGTVNRLRVPGDVTAAAGDAAQDVWLDAAATGGSGVTSLDSDVATQEVVFATRSGALGAARLDRGGQHTVVLAGGSCTSFAAVRFVSTGGSGHRAAGGCSSHVIATVGSTPGCCMYDTSGPPSCGPVLRCAGSSPGQRFRCLAVEPGISHGALVAAGCADGAAACVWDTRQPATPLWCWSQHAGGGASASGAYCTTVAFDPGACFSSSSGEEYGQMARGGGGGGGTTSTQRTSGLLLGTSAGVLLGCTVSKGQVPQVALARETVAHCAVIPTSGQQLAAVTGGECLLLWDARSAGAIDPMM